MFIVATAASTAAFSISTPSQSFSLAEADKTTKLSDRYMKWIASHPRLSSAETETSLLGPTRISAQWLCEVQERIQRSLLPRGQKNDGRWLTEEIAVASSSFFETTSDLLPSEPYIYSSSKGDLIAEFKSDGGSMTGVITPEFVGLFAMVDGVPVERTLSFADPTKSMRQGLLDFTETIRTKQHGAVGTRS